MLESDEGQDALNKAQKGLALKELVHKALTLTHKVLIYKALTQEYKVLTNKEYTNSGNKDLGLTYRALSEPVSDMELYTNFAFRVAYKKELDTVAVAQVQFAQNKEQHNLLHLVQVFYNILTNTSLYSILL